MTDLSAVPSLPGNLTTRSRVALLVDGDNIPHRHAGELILAAARHGEVMIRRVYGNAALIPGWGEAPGYRLVHSGTGKNATDLLLAVEAMALMLGGRAEVLAIASSDRDFTHLATHLREAGITVVGLGEAKATEAFRSSCSHFKELRALTAVAAAPSPREPASTPIAGVETALHVKVRKLIADEGENGAMHIGKLGGRMGSLHKVKISEHALKTWRAYLLGHPNLFQCDPKGPNAKVRLKG